MDVSTIVVGLIAFFAAVFGMTKLKNNHALKKNKEANDLVDSLAKLIAKNEGKLEAEEVIRADAKAKLEKELGKEVSDEELADFINNRYPKQ